MAGADSTLTFDLVIMFFTIVIGIEGSKWLKIPGSVGLILTGIIVGPSILDVVESTELVHFLSEIGIIFLLFHVGLENDVSLLKSKPAIFTAIFGLVLPLIGGFGIAYLFGVDFDQSLLIGIIATATSIGITTAILKEFGVSNRPFSKTILGAAVADDILGLIALSLFITLIISEDSGVFETLIALSFSFIILIVALIIGTRLVIITKYAANKGLSDSSVYILGIAIAVFASVISEDVGISGIVGAFLVGLMIKGKQFEKEAHKLDVSFHTLVAIFSPVFFLNLGLQVDLTSLIDGFTFGLVLTIIAIFTKFVGSYLGAILGDLDKHSSLIVGMGMVPRGEVALVVANVGFSLGLLEAEIFSAVVIMAVLTSFFPPLLLTSLLKPYIHAKSPEELQEMRQNVEQRWSMYNVAGFYKFVQDESGKLTPFSESFVRDRVLEKGGSEDETKMILETIKARLQHSKNGFMRKKSIGQIIENTLKKSA